MRSDINYTRIRYLDDQKRDRIAITKTVAVGDQELFDYVHVPHGFAVADKSDSDLYRDIAQSR